MKNSFWREQRREIIAHCVARPTLHFSKLENDNDDLAAALTRNYSTGLCKNGFIARPPPRAPATPAVFALGPRIIGNLFARLKIADKFKFNCRHVLWINAPSLSLVSVCSERLCTRFPGGMDFLVERTLRTVLNIFRMCGMPQRPFLNRSDLRIRYPWKTNNCTLPMRRPCLVCSQDHTWINKKGRYFNF